MKKVLFTSPPVGDRHTMLTKYDVNAGADDAALSRSVQSVYVHLPSSSAAVAAYTGDRRYFYGELQLIFTAAIGLSRTHADAYQWNGRGCGVMTDDRGPTQQVYYRQVAYMYVNK